MDKIDDKRPLFARAYIERAEGEGENAETQMRVSVSSNTPCYNVVRTKRGYAVGKVILSHDEGAIDPAWIEGGIVLRNEHYGKVVARGVDCRIEDGKLVANKIIWGSSEAAKVIKADAEAGVIREMSIEADYSTDDVEEIGDDEFVIRKWTPLAAAFVAVPADPTVGINRELFRSSVEAHATETKAEQTDASAPADEAANIKREKPPMDKTNTEGDTLEKTIPTIQVVDNSAELTREEVEQYSVLRAIRSIVERKPELAKVERAVSAKLEKEMGKVPQGIFMPTCNLGRAFTTGGGSGSGLVPTEHLASEFVAILRNKLVLGRVGTRYLTGLRGNVSIPKQTAATSAYWVAEGVAPTASNPVIGQIAMTPHTVGGFTDITRRLMEQASPDADELVQNDLYEAIALAIQDAALAGDGQNGKPLGIINTPSITEATVATPGSPTFKELCAFGGAIDQWFIDGGNWVVNPETFAALRGTKRFAASGGDRTMADIIAGQKYIADEPAYTTGQLAAGTAIYGKFDNLCIGMWGALDLTVDPYSLSTSGSLRVVALQDVDVAVRHAEAFVVSDELPQA